MAGRFSARTVISLAAAAATFAVVALLAAVVQQSLADSYPSAIRDTVSAAWTVGVLLIVFVTLATWGLASFLFRPITSIRNDLTLAARSRALAEPPAGESAEMRLLRRTLVTVLSDLERQIAAAELDQRRVLGLFEALNEGIVQIGANGRFAHVNGAGRRLLGLPQHPEGQSPAAFIRSEELRDVMERCARGEAVEPTEVVIDARPLLVTPRPLPLSDGRSDGSVMTIVDLTELRRLETVRRDFVANVSHELKTPLTSIRGYAETLLTDEMPREVQRQFLEVIHKNGTLLQRIVEDLLDLSRLQSGGWLPNLQDVEAASLANDAWSSCEPNTGKKKIRFAVTGGPAHVSADPDGLRQVFSNLLENALRYTPERGTIEVNISTPPNSIGNRSWIDIDVKDSGIGIPGDALPRIFERFYRVDPARSRADGGTGLGLAIVKHLVESMSGQVSAESRLGKGTTIKLRLPAVKE